MHNREEVSSLKKNESRITRLINPPSGLICQLQPCKPLWTEKVLMKFGLEYDTSQLVMVNRFKISMMHLYL